MPLRERHNRWHYRFQIDGRTYQGATDLAATERNRTSAEMIEHEHRKGILEGRQWRPRLAVRLFSDAAREFLEWAKLEHRGYPGTYYRLATSFSSLKNFFAGEPVGLIDPKRIEQYKGWRMIEHQVRDVTLRHDLHALSKFMQWAARMNYAPAENPVRLVRIPSDADAVRIHVITPDEEIAYFSRATGNVSDLAMLMLEQGTRPEEVLSLGKDEVDFDRARLHIRRGKSPAARRTLRLTEQSKLILGRRMAGSSLWIFPSPKKPGRHIARLNGAHNEVCRAAELDFVLYDFRHTFATRMAQKGVDLATLAAILGHSSLRSVMKYVHPTAEHQREAMRRYDEARQAERAPESAHGLSVPGPLSAQIQR